MPDFWDEEQYYDSIKADIIAAGVGLTSWVYNAVIRGIVRVVARVCARLDELTRVVYMDIFPQLAAPEGILNHIKAFGQSWNDEWDEEAARKQAMSNYRQRFLGTAPWYKSETLAAFPDVSAAWLEISDQYPGVGTLYVNTGSASALNLTLLAEIQDYFDDTARDVGGYNVTVVNWS